MQASCHCQSRQCQPSRSLRGRCDAVQASETGAPACERRAGCSDDVPRMMMGQHCDWMGDGCLKSLRRQPGSARASPGAAQRAHRHEASTFLGNLASSNERTGLQCTAAAGSTVMCSSSRRLATSCAPHTAPVSTRHARRQRGGGVGGQTRAPLWKAQRARRTRCRSSS